MAALQHPGLPLSLQPFTNEDYLLMTHINPGTAWMKSVINQYTDSPPPGVVVALFLKVLYPNDVFIF